MKNTIIGIDLGGTKISAAIATDKGKVLAIKTVPTEAKLGLAHVVSRMTDLVNALCIGTGRPFNSIKCVGVGAPGPVIASSGTVVNPPNLPGWGKVALRPMLEKRLKTKVVLENDANAAAIGELRFGAGKKFSDFVYVTVSTGIGGGIVINKQLFRGSSGSAGEVGHMVIDMNGPKCPCGRKGHLEGMAAGPAIHKQAGMSPRDIEMLAKKGNKKAKAQIELAAYRIGTGFANIAHILNPEAIIVGGGVSSFGKPFFDAINKRVKECVISGVRVKVIPAKLKKDVGVIGALALCL